MHRCVHVCRCMHRKATTPYYKGKNFPMIQNHQIFFTSKQPINHSYHRHIHIHHSHQQTAVNPQTYTNTDTNVNKPPTTNQRRAFTHVTQLEHAHWLIKIGREIQQPIRLQETPPPPTPAQHQKDPNFRHPSAFCFHYLPTTANMRMTDALITFHLKPTF